MKCQSFCALVPSRLSLLVLSTTGVCADCAYAVVARNSKAQPHKVVRRALISGCGSRVSRPLDVLQDVAEQKDRSGDDDSARVAPCDLQRLSQSRRSGDRKTRDGARL